MQSQHQRSVERQMQTLQHKPEARLGGYRKYKTEKPDQTQSPTSSERRLINKTGHPSFMLLANRP
jgi:hypothetical protein